eukprot:g22486.t1
MTLCTWATLHKGMKKQGLLASLGVTGGTDLSLEEEEGPGQLEDDSEDEAYEEDTAPSPSARAPQLDQYDDGQEQDTRSQRESSSRKYREAEPREQKAGRLAEEQSGAGSHSSSQPDRSDQPAPAAAGAHATRAKADMVKTLIPGVESVDSEPEDVVLSKALSLLARRRGVKACMVKAMGAGCPVTRVQGSVPTPERCESVPLPENSNVTTNGNQ